jgi:hypothetical protein
VRAIAALAAMQYALRVQSKALPRQAFPDDVKVACPPVKRIVVVRVHVGEPFWSTSGLVEEAVLKTVAPSKVSGVQIPGAPLFHPCSSIESEPPRPKRQMRVQLSPGMPRSAWCKSRTFGSQPEDLGALPGAGAFFITFYSSKVEHPADNRETGEHYLVEGPFLAV